MMLESIDWVIEWTLEGVQDFVTEYDLGLGSETECDSLPTSSVPLSLLDDERGKWGVPVVKQGSMT